MLTIGFATLRIGGALRAGLASAILPALVACTVGYQADVRNDTAQPISVAIVHGDSTGQPNALAMQRIGPNSRAQVVRYGVPHDWTVYLQADAQGNPGWPVQMDLKPGLMVVRVTQDGNVPTGKLHMEQVDR